MCLSKRTNKLYSWRLDAECPLSQICEILVVTKINEIAGAQNIIIIQLSSSRACAHTEVFLTLLRMREHCCCMFNYIFIVQIVLFARARGQNSRLWIFTQRTRNIIHKKKSIQRGQAASSRLWMINPKLLTTTTTRRSDVHQTTHANSRASKSNTMMGKHACK